MFIPGSPLRPLFLMWCLIVTVLSFRRVCYFTNWSCDLLIPRAYFCLRDINPGLCSHLMYAFAKINQTDLKLLPTRPDDIQGEKGELGRYVLFNNFKRINPELVTLLSIGGSLQKNTGFAEAVATKETRRIFSWNCVEFLRTWGFDGLDVDWEYPGNPEETRTNFTLLLADLRLVFKEEARVTGQRKLLLSMAAPVNEEIMTKGYEIDKVARIVDFVNLMSYDFHGSWNRITGFNAPLYGRTSDWKFHPSLSVVWAINSWIKRGAQPEKLNVGIAGYGTSYTVAKNSTFKVGSLVVGPGKPGPYRVMKGQLAYYEICQLFDQGAVYQWDDIQKVPYAYVNYTWVGYDDERSVEAKVDWMISQRLGGVMFWSLDMDDYKGTFCKKGKYPLLTSIVKTVGKYFPGVTVPSKVPTTITVATTTNTLPVTELTTTVTSVDQATTVPTVSMTTVVAPAIISSTRQTTTRSTSTSTSTPNGVTSKTRNVQQPESTQEVTLPNHVAQTPRPVNNVQTTVPPSTPKLDSVNKVPPWNPTRNENPRKDHDNLNKDNTIFESPNEKSPSQSAGGKKGSHMTVGSANQMTGKIWTLIFAFVQIVMIS